MSYSKNLIDKELKRPHYWPDDRWKVEEIDNFISRVHANGAPDNRYNTYSIIKRSEDLHKLDAVYRQLRRLAVTLDKIYPDGMTAYQKLEANAKLDLAHQSAPWAKPDPFFKKTNEFYLTATTKNHLEGSPRGACDGAIFEGATNSPIYLMLAPLLENHNRPAADIDQALEDANWLLSNVKLNSSDEAEIKRLVRARQKSVTP